MARIFLSSTFADLQDYRRAAHEALRRLGHEVISLEDYTAVDQAPLERTLADIARADLYVGTVAWRYGYVPEGQDQSVTEIEYRHAQKLNKPTLIFLASEDAQISPKVMDPPDDARIKRFRDALSRERIVDFFTSVDDFRAKLITAVARWDRERTTRSAILTLDELPLAWRLVVDSKAKPDLLRHLDAGAFTSALEQWEEQSGLDRNAPWQHRLDRAVSQLEAKQTPRGPSMLWLAWMRATQTRDLTSGGPTRLNPESDTAPLEDSERESKKQV